MIWAPESLPEVGWPTAIALAIALAGLINANRDQASKRRARELQDPEKAKKDAVASRDPDRIRIAAMRLRDARRKAGAA